MLILLPYVDPHPREVLLLMEKPDTPIKPDQPTTFSTDESKYIKRGLIFGFIVLLLAGNVYYDDVYNDGVSTSVKSKIKRFLAKKKQATPENTKQLEVK